MVTAKCFKTRPTLPVDAFGLPLQLVNRRAIWIVSGLGLCCRYTTKKCSLQPRQHYSFCDEGRTPQLPKQ